jgi:hypothetical protein
MSDLIPDGFIHRLYRNKKTGGQYQWLAAGIDCTNSRDGATVVVYCPVDDEHTIYVREQAEFYEKFEPVQLGLLDA